MTDIVPVHKGAALAAFEPQSLPELIQLSEVMARSEMVPKDYRGKAGNIVVAIMSGREIGLSANQALQSYAIINGRAMLWGDAPLALVRASGKLASGYPKEGHTGTIKDGTRTGFCTVKRVGEDDEVTYTFSMDDAKTAKLWGKDGPWQQYPDRMLIMRPRSFLMRDKFGDVLKGVAIAEEYQGHEEVNVTPQPPTGNEGLRDKLAATLGASGITHVGFKTPPTLAPDPAPVAVAEGVVEDPIPDFSRMLKDQIQEVLDREGHDAGMTLEQFRGVITATLQGDREKRRPLTRETAVEVVRAIRAWVNPNPHAPNEDEAADIGRPADAPPTSNVCTECGGNGYEGGDERSEAPCGMCSGTGKMHDEEPEMPL